jgi:hypothetical protein
MSSARKKDSPTVLRRNQIGLAWWEIIASGAGSVQAAAMPDTAIYEPASKPVAHLIKYNRSFIIQAVRRRRTSFSYTNETPILIFAWLRRDKHTFPDKTFCNSFTLIPSCHYDATARVGFI